MKNKFNFVDLCIATNPENYDVAKIYCNYYFVIHKESKSILLNSNGDAMCNMTKNIVSRLIGGMFDEKQYEIQQIPVVFVEWDCSQHIPAQ